MTTQEQTQGSENETKLYAGKYKTVDDLEAAYKSSAVVFDENSRLKRQVEDLTKIPDAYQNPTDMTIEANRATDLQARAREAGMTQAQYEKFLRSDAARVEKYKETFEGHRKEIGESQLNILDDYVKKHYPKELQDGILKTLVVNKEARASALAHREHLLNNRTPGMDKVTAGASAVSEDDIKKAYEQKEKTRSMKDIQAYTNLIAAKANEKAA